MNIIFHIDVNNAFLSWTAVDMLKKGYNKDIRNIPSIIGGDEDKRHGIVLAKSPVAKKYGIVTAETIYMAKKKCPNLEIYKANYDLYVKESRKLYEYFCQFTPNVERYSIDECFLDFTGTSYLYNDYLKLARSMQKYINDYFSITVNIGIANNKLCAKMASDFEKPNKIHTLFLDEVEKKMWPLPVGELFMVGKKSTELLNQIGIKTIGDLAKADINILTKYFKNNAKIMIDSANGIDYTKVGYYVAKDRSISTTITTKEDIDDIIKLKDILLLQVDKVGRNLRKYNKYTTVITIIFKNSNFLSYTHQSKLTNPVNTTEDIYKEACKILEAGWKKDSIRLIGIKLGGLTDKKVEQFTLFDDNISTDKNDKMQNVIDNINEKYGDAKIIPASMKKNIDI